MWLVGVEMHRPWLSLRMVGRPPGTGAGHLCRLSHPPIPTPNIPPPPSGQVWSWGDGDYGKLGRGGSDGCKTPKPVEKLQDLDIVKVCCGSQFSMALTKEGQLYTWGKGDNQRLGHGTDEHVRYPKLLDSLQGECVSARPCAE